MDKVKVAIVDDDSDWIKQFIFFINNQEDMLITWAATNKNDAIQLAQNSNTDIILMDVNLGGPNANIDGIAAAREIKQIQQVKIIMMTSNSDEDVVKKAVIAGASNYILKEDFRQIPSAIRSTYHEKSPLEAVLRDYSKLKELEQLEQLTPTEKQIFILIEKGHGKEQICNDLCISEGTLKKHISNILKKFDVGSMKEAIRMIKGQGV